MPLTTDEIHDLNAVESKKRDLRVKLAKIRGELAASAAASKFFARINQDTQIQREQAEAELRDLEESGAIGILDGWGMFTPTDRAAKSERSAGATSGLQWLKANPTSTQTEFVTAVASGLESARVAAGRNFRLNVAAGIAEMWVRTAVARKRATDWESFKTYVLAALSDEDALENME